jgi:hypothetical protein
MSRGPHVLAACALGLLAVLLGSDQTVFGKNVDLSTVPDRGAVQLTIYNSEDLTLVRERRKVSFKTGANPLQFSWSNTLIDPSSVELSFITHDDKLELLDTTFPHDKPHMLYWNVKSSLDGEAMVEITYFTSGISWAADYVCIADADEKQMNVESYVRVTNSSGEQYDNAQVRLVVGQINLVEKIAQLAQISLSEADALKQKRGREYYFGAKMMFDNFDTDAQAGAGYGGSGGLGGGGAMPKRVIKEGLSEYFIYTIEGTETIPNGWSKRLRSFRQTDVPFDIEYRYRVPEYGEQLVRMYLLKNDKESKLGETPLPDGVVRVFKQNGRTGLSYVTAQSIKYVPIGDKIELNLGADPRVIFEWIKTRSWRTHIWLRMGGARALRRVDDGKVKVEVNGTVVGWDEHGHYVQRIRNYSNKAIRVEVRRVFPGHVVFRNALGATKHDYQTVEFSTTVKAGRSADLTCEVVQHMGRNKKQDNVKLVDSR